MPYGKNIFDIFIYRKLYKRVQKLQRVNSSLHVILFFYLILASFMIGYNYEEMGLPKINPSTTAQVSHTPGVLDCANMTMQETAICLNEYVRTIFIYNITDDNLYLTLDELKERGGDCKDWTDFYEREMKQYGYDSERVVIYVDQDERAQYFHTFLIARNYDGYCLMDMQALNCYTYADSDGNPRKKS